MAPLVITKDRQCLPPTLTLIQCLGNHFLSIIPVGNSPSVSQKVPHWIEKTKLNTI